jgi:hypothetical protein
MQHGQRGALSLPIRNSNRQFTMTIPRLPHMTVPDSLAQDVSPEAVAENSESEGNRMKTQSLVTAAACCCLSLSAVEGGAAVVPLGSPSQIPNAERIHFDNQPAGTAANTLFESQGVTFTRDDGAAVYIMDWTVLNRQTTSPSHVLATIRVTEPAWATHLNVISSRPVMAMGAYFGNDQNGTDFSAIRMSAYDSAGELLGFVMVAANNNTHIDQFIGLASDVPIARVRFENQNSSGAATEGLSVVIDDLVFSASRPWSVSANPNVLWPPNNKMVPVTISVEAGDGPALLDCRIVAVRSNEPAGHGNGRCRNEQDWEITGDLTVDLRAQRLGHGKCRIYTIDVECIDATGNTPIRSVTVTVPKSRAKKPRRG